MNNPGGRSTLVIGTEAQDQTEYRQCQKGGPKRDVLRQPPYRPHATHQEEGDEKLNRQYRDRQPMQGSNGKAAHPNVRRTKAI